MATKIGKTCNVPGCAGIAYRNQYCDKHQHLYKQSKYSTTKSYGNEWRKISKQFLAKHPICEICGVNKAVLSHHIVERADGGSDDEENLLACCSMCHNKIHANDKLNGGKKYTY